MLPQALSASFDSLTTKTFLKVLVYQCECKITIKFMNVERLMFVDPETGGVGGSPPINEKHNN